MSIKKFSMNFILGAVLLFIGFLSFQTLAGTTSPGTCAKIKCFHGTCWCED